MSDYPIGTRVTHAEYLHWSGEVVFVDEDGMLHVKWDHPTRPSDGPGYISPLRVKPEQPPVSAVDTASGKP